MIVRVLYPLYVIPFHERRESMVSHSEKSQMTQALQDTWMIEQSTVSRVNRSRLESIGPTCDENSLRLQQWAILSHEPIWSILGEYEWILSHRNLAFLIFATLRLTSERLASDLSTREISYRGFLISQTRSHDATLASLAKQVLRVTRRIYLSLKPEPSQLRHHVQLLRRILRLSRTNTQEHVICRVAPWIRAWQIFYRWCALSESKSCDLRLYEMLWRWSCRRHPKKSRAWVKKKYFQRMDEKYQRFAVWDAARQRFICLPSHYLET